MFVWREDVFGMVPVFIVLICGVVGFRIGVLVVMNGAGGGEVGRMFCWRDVLGVVFWIVESLSVRDGGNVCVCLLLLGY